MRILHISSGDFFSSYGGGQVYVKNIASQMSIEDDVFILSFTDSASVREREYNAIRIFEIPYNTTSIDGIVKRIAPDVIHAHGHKVMACMCGKRLGIPVVVTAHHGGILCPGGALLDSEDKICAKNVCHQNCLPCVLRNIRGGIYCYPFLRHLKEPAYYKIGNFLEHKPFVLFFTPIFQSAYYIRCKREEWDMIVSNCTHVIAPCNAVADAMVRNGLNSDKISIIPHGIPLPSVSEIKSPHDGITRFFYLGRICYVKGIHVLLDAFHQTEVPDVELHLIGGAGNKAEERYMRGLQRKYSMDKRIIWHGKIDHSELFPMIQYFDISVAPSIFLEIFGLNIAESLAIGKPVLATRCGGAEMQIVEGENGWLVEPGDVKALRDKILEAKNTFHSLDSSRIARDVVSIETHCKVLKQLYKSLSYQYEKVGN